MDPRTITDNLPDDIWLIRPCEIYKEEYKDCKALLSQWYQYYIDGTRRDCAQWNKDYNNCMKFRQSRDADAAAAIIEVERERRKQRLQLARANDIWEYRSSPPLEWSRPLPILTKEKKNDES